MLSSINECICLSQLTPYPHPPDIFDIKPMFTNKASTRFMWLKCLQENPCYKSLHFQLNYI